MEETDGLSLLINSSMAGQYFGGFDSGMACIAPGMLASDGSHLSQQERTVFAQELAGIGRALN